MWKPDLHPRDEYGRFKLRGESGFWHTIEGNADAHAHARTIAAWQANQARQSAFVAKRDAGTLTHAEDVEWDRLAERAAKLRDQLPKAYFMGLRPHEDGTWWSQPGERQFGPTDAHGNRLPPMLLAGAVRVGDHPNPGRTHFGALGNGVWHRRWEYAPGRVPILRNDYGHRMSSLEPEPSRSRADRSQRGAFARGEIKAGQRQFAGGEPKEIRRRGKEVRLATPEAHGAYQNDPRNPVGRMRTARKKRQRASTTTWIQRLNAQMEGR